MDFITQRKLGSANKRWERLTEKAEALERQRDLETRVEEQMRIDSLLEGLQADIEKVETEITNLSPPAQSTSQPTTRVAAAPTNIQSTDNRNTPHPIFISYRRDDSIAASQVVATLQSAGLPVWFDQSSISAGDAWLLQVKENVDRCSLFVPLLSRNTLVDEGEAMREWNLALERLTRLSRQATFIIPIVIDQYVNPDSPHIPTEFWSKQVVVALDGVLSDRDLADISSKYSQRTAN